MVPETLPAGSLRDLLTIFLDPSSGKGGILNVVNGTGLVLVPQAFGSIRTSGAASNPFWI